jgi:putative Mn2+ efflux pump MntP
MKSVERVLLVNFGVILSGAGLYALFLSDVSPAWRYLGGGLLCAVGIHAIYCGLTGKRSWISRIGR